MIDLGHQNLPQDFSEPDQSKDDNPLDQLALSGVIHSQNQGISFQSESLGTSILNNSQSGEIFTVTTTGAATEIASEAITGVSTGVTGASSSMASGASLHSGEPLEVNNNITSESTSKQPAKRSRGRPFGSVKAKVSEETEANSSTSTGTKRRPGRPRIHVASFPLTEFPLRSLSDSQSTPKPTTVVSVAQWARVQAPNSQSLVTPPQPPREITSASLNSVPRTRTIIPNLNSDEAVSTAGEELDDLYELGLDGDGIGDDEYTGDDGGGDDDPDPVLQSSTPDENGKKKSRPLAEWFQVLVKEKVTYLQQKDNRRKFIFYPTIQSFWLPHKANWFRMLNTKDLHPACVYNPRFFYWDPILLIDVLCPKCQTKLGHHTISPQPHRCVDLEGSFWMIGARYHCKECLNPKSGKKSTTFMSWDSRIIASLPKALSLEFPAVLTHRSALSAPVFALQQGVFQTEMGTKQFGDMLRVLHVRKYDLLQIQYLEMINYMRIGVAHVGEMLHFQHFLLLMTKMVTLALFHVHGGSEIYMTNLLKLMRKK